MKNKTQKKTTSLWAKMKAKFGNLKQKALNWMDAKIFDFIMAHTNLEETILIATSKAATERFHITSLFLLVTYHVWRLELKVKKWFIKSVETSNG